MHCIGLTVSLDSLIIHSKSLLTSFSFQLVFLLDSKKDFPVEEDDDEEGNETSEEEPTPVDVKPEQVFCDYRITVFSGHNLTFL